MTDGPLWQVQRRFCLKNLRDFGFGKQQMEELIAHEASHMINYLKKQSSLSGDSGVAMESIFTIPVLNTLWTMTAGQQLEYDDPCLLKLTQLLNTFFKKFDMSGSILNYLPVLRFIAPELTGYNSIKACRDALWQYFQVSLLY